MISASVDSFVTYDSKALEQGKQEAIYIFKNKNEFTVGNRVNLENTSFIAKLYLMKMHLKHSIFPLFPEQLSKCYLLCVIG